MKIKINSNHGEEAIFKDLDSADSGDIKRPDNSAKRDEFLSDLAIGTMRVFRKKFARG